MIKTKDLESFVLPVLLAGALLLVWHWGVRLAHTNIFPSPAMVWKGMGELARR